MTDDRTIGERHRPSWRDRLTQPLSPHHATRLRLHLALIPVYVWAIFAWTTFAIDFGVAGRLDRSGHIKGHDFLHFYVLGEIARDRQAADLYSFDRQAARVDRIVPEYAARFLPVHTPQVAVFFAPLARLSYVTAVTTWLILTAVLYASCCRVLWKALPRLRAYPDLVLVLTIGFPAFQTAIATGQTSAFTMAWFTLGYLALRRDRNLLAGLALGALAYKPTFGLLLPPAFLLARQFRVAAGAAVAVLLEFGIAWAWFGGGALSGYVHNFNSVMELRPLLEAQPEAMHSLLAFFSLLLPSASLAKAAYVFSSLAVGVLAVWTWKGQAPLELRYAVLVIATVLVSPHLYTYDLVVLAPAFFLTASWLLGSSRRSLALWVLLYLAYYLSSLEGLVHLTKVQWTVPVLVSLLIHLAASARREALTPA